MAGEKASVYFENEIIANIDSSRKYIMCWKGKQDIITKTRLFEYIENFTTKKKKIFRQKNLIFFIFLLKT